MKGWFSASVIFSFAILIQICMIANTFRQSTLWYFIIYLAKSYSIVKKLQVELHGTDFIYSMYLCVYRLSIEIWFNNLVLPFEYENTMQCLVEFALKSMTGRIKCFFISRVRWQNLSEFKKKEEKMSGIDAKHSIGPLIKLKIIFITISK